MADKRTKADTLHVVYSQRDGRSAASVHEVFTDIEKARAFAQSHNAELGKGLDHANKAFIQSGTRAELAATDSFGHAFKSAASPAKAVAAPGEAKAPKGASNKAVARAAKQLADAAESYRSTKAGDLTAVRAAAGRLQDAHNALNALRDRFPSPTSMTDPSNAIYRKIGELGNLIDRDRVPLSDPRVKALVSDLEGHVSGRSSAANAAKPQVSQLLPKPETAEAAPRTRRVDRSSLVAETREMRDLGRRFHAAVKQGGADLPIRIEGLIAESHSLGLSDAQARAAIGSPSDAPRAEAFRDHAASNRRIYEQAAAAKANRPQGIDLTAGSEEARVGRLAAKDRPAAAPTPANARSASAKGASNKALEKQRARMARMGVDLGTPDGGTSARALKSALDSIEAERRSVSAKPAKGKQTTKPALLMALDKTPANALNPAARANAELAARKERVRSGTKVSGDVTMAALSAKPTRTAKPTGKLGLAIAVGSTALGLYAAMRGTPATAAPAAPASTKTRTDPYTTADGRQYRNGRLIVRSSH